MGRRSISGKPSSPGSALGCWAFCLIFLLAGLLGLWMTTLGPLVKIYQARSWQPVDCTILTSEVESHSGSDSTTYSIAITYSYTFEGVQYAGDRYDFSSGSSSGYDGKAAVVERYPPNSKILCFVDPQDPNSAIIQRGPGTYLLWGLLPVPFLIIGLIGIFALLANDRNPGPSGRATRLRSSGSRSRPVAGPVTSRQNDATTMLKNLAAGARAHSPSMPKASLGHRESPPLPGFEQPNVGSVIDKQGPLDLESGSSSRVAVFAALALFALLWNGGLIWFGNPELLSGNDLDWLNLFFLVPFFLVGLGVIGLSIYFGLGIFNPHIHLTLSDADLGLGGDYSVRWKLSGRAERIQKLTVRLEGLEVAIYRRGTDTRTDRSIFHQEILLDETYMRFKEGSFTLALPAGAMPTFRAPHNEIQWRLKVIGDIPWWPDLKETFPLEVSFAPPSDSRNRI